MSGQTIQQLLQSAVAFLLANYDPGGQQRGALQSPKTDVEVLLAYCLDQPREFFYTHPEFVPEQTVCDAFSKLLKRRAQGEPVAYLVGKRAFWDFEVEVNSHVLVPRPETELLVEASLELLDKNADALLADLGTGSGAIAIALARSCAKWRVVAIDSSQAALQIAQRNGSNLALSNVKWQLGSWCDQLASNAFDLIVSNPPYVAPGDPHLDEGDLRFEPSVALQAGHDGYADLFAIAEHARDNLKSEGWLLLEHGADQHQLLREKLFALGYINVSGRQDLSGHWRIVQAQWPSPQEN